MNELVFFLIAGAVFLLLFLFWFLKGQPRTADETVVMKELEQVVSLLGLASTKSALILDDSDYRFLRSNPQMWSLARELQRDRRAIVLLWLNHLQQDVRTLWRFRRLLVRNGVSVRLSEEFYIATTAVLALAYLFALRAVVSVVGPFALPALLRQARKLVEAGSRSCAQLLDRVPPAMRPEIERQWAAEFSASAGN